MNDNVESNSPPKSSSPVLNVAASKDNKASKKVVLRDLNKEDNNQMQQDQMDSETSALGLSFLKKLETKNDGADQNADLEVSNNAILDIEDRHNLPHQGRNQQYNNILTKSKPAGFSKSGLDSQPAPIDILDSKSVDPGSKRMRTDILESSFEETKQPNRGALGTSKPPVENPNRIALNIEGHKPPMHIIRPLEGDEGPIDIVEIQPLNKEDAIEPRKLEFRAPKPKPKPNYWKNKIWPAISRCIDDWDEERCAGCIQLCCCLIYVIGIFAVLSALMAFNFRYKEINLMDVSHPLEYVARNLHSDPIMEVIRIQPFEMCPEGYSQLQLGYWPGTDEGCLCSGNDLKYGSCDASDGGEFCDNVAEVDSASIENWVDSKWCALRAFMNKDYIKSISCPEGFSECAPGLCFWNETACPITSLKITSEAINENSTLFGETYLTSIREIGLSPIIDIKATVNNLPCFDSYKTPKKGESYKLLRDPPQGCGKYGIDQFSFFLDKASQDALLSANWFTRKVFNLPLYTSFLKTTEVYLSVRTKFLIIKSQACERVDVDRIFEATSSIFNLHRAIRGTTLTGFIYHLGIFIGFGVYIVNTQTSKLDKKFLRHKSGIVKFVYFIAFGLENIIYMVMVGLVLQEFFILEDVEKDFRLWRNAECLPLGQPSDVLSDFLVLMDTVVFPIRVYAISLVVVSLGTYFFLVCFALCRYCNKIF